LHARDRFSQGMKVCVEIVLMAANAGLIQQGENVISIGGTDIGADTAVVIRSSTSLDFDNFQVREIICKPLSSTPVKHEVVQSRTEQLKMKKFENDK
jgi:hypothetical protein